ncbi:MAG TPA: PTS sugar transporter subunit IIC [Firmicutes bacterium]|nr:PTS sugar transporter subunit IIC [Bacillota bacterium]
MSVFQAALIALFYYLSMSPWIAGLGYWTLYRPLVAGLVVGIIMGDPVQGTIVGATINLLYLGFISAGGSLPADPALAGYLGTALALATDMEVQAALALAVPIGLLGGIIWFTRMTFDAIFVHWADGYAARGSTAGVSFCNIVPPQILLFIVCFFPAFFACLYGPSAVQGLIAFLGARVFKILMVIGGMLPALGIAINLRALARRDTMVVYFLGFFLAVYLKLDIIAVGAFSVVLALLHLIYVKGGLRRERAA